MGDLLAKVQQIPHNLAVRVRGEILLTEWIYLLVARGLIFSQLFFLNAFLFAETAPQPWLERIEAGRESFQQTRYVDALGHFRAAQEAGEKGNWPAEVRGQVLTSIGGCLLGLSDYKGALAQFLAARPYTVEGGNREHLAALDANMASVYLYQGDGENAAKLYRQALRWLADRPGSGHRPPILANLGVVEMQAGRYRRALEYEEAALGALPGSAGGERRAAIEDLRGIAWLGLRDYSRARQSFERGLDLRRGAGERSDLTRSWMFLGRTEWERGDPAAALKKLETAVAQARERDNRVALWAALYLRGQCRRALGRAEGAAVDLRESVEVIEAIRAGLVPTDALRVRFEVSHHQVYEALVGLQCEKGATAEAFQTLEMARAQSLRALVRNRTGAAAEKEPTLWMRYADRLARLESARARAATAPSEEEAGRWRRRLDELEAELRESEARLRVEDPVLSQSVFAPALGLAQAQRELDPQTVLLNYHVGARSAHLWVVTDRETRFHRLAPPSEWGPEVRRFVDATQARGGGAGTAGRRLYQALLGPAEGALLDRPHWIIAADGDLGSVPFAALPAPSGRYLVEEHALSVTPSISVLYSLRGRGPRRYSAELLGVADPVVNRADPRGAGAAACPEPQTCFSLPRLVSSGAEVAACARLLGPGQATLLEGLRASEAELRRAARTPHRYWHFSSHVVVDGERPNNSFVALSLPERLTVFDILGLPVRAEMVVLNGCDSGAGKALPGAGVLGLARAFLAAGAQSVCATRWKIPDEGGALVQRLYAHLQGPVTRAEALRRAQREMIRSGDWRAEPRYWAAYFLVGDGGSKAAAP